MGFLGQDFDTVYEPTTVMEGEYQLRVLSAEVKTSKTTGGEMIQVRLDIPSETTTKDITHTMMLPTAQDDPKKRNGRLSAIQNFLIACGLNPATTGNVDEVIGCTPWAILAEEESEGFGMQNRVKKFVTGK